MKPLAIDLFCGLFGWSAGLVAEGYQVIGFDLEDMHANFGMPRPPEFRLVIQDVLTLHGSQFRTADLIVASPPCQAYSYRAMPWKRAKALPPPDNTLFDACFRIQREACAAAGRHIPMIVENVRGAQPWVGRARWNYGSFYLWGDVPALMPNAKAIKVPTMGAGWYPPDHPKHVPGLAFNTHADRHTKNTGGSWFNVAHNTTSGKGQTPDGRKAPGGTQWFNDGPRTKDSLASSGSKSPARKFASAMIAKIPLPLSRWIAKAYYPRKVPRSVGAGLGCQSTPEPLQRGNFRP